MTKKYWKQLTPVGAFFGLLRYILMLAVLICVCYPFLYVLFMSLSNPQAVKSGELLFFPKDFTLAAYRLCFESPMVLKGLVVSVARTVVGTVVTLATTSMAAFALTKVKYRGMKALNQIFIITAYVSGGLIPTYLVLKGLHLIGSFWAYIFPTAVSVFGLIVIKTFIQGLPPSLEESATIDGANSFVVFWQIIFPLCKPVIAAIGMFTVINQWNAYMDTILYNSMDRSLYTLQFYLYMILTSQNVASLQAASTQAAAAGGFSAQTVTMAVTVVSVLPIFAVFPFIQKHFTSGLLVGAVKE